MLWKSDSFFGSNLIPKRIFLWKQVSCAKLPDLLYNFGRKSHVYSSGSFAFGAAFMFKSCCIWQQIICFLCPIYDEHFLIGILNFSAYVSSVLYSNRWIYWKKIELSFNTGEVWTNPSTSCTYKVSKRMFNPFWASNKEIVHIFSKHWTMFCR